MTLSVIIGVSEEALKAVPDTYREATLALGATKLQTIFRVVFPAFGSSGYASRRPSLPGRSSNNQKTTLPVVSVKKVRYII